MPITISQYPFESLREAQERANRALRARQEILRRTGYDVPSAPPTFSHIDPAITPDTPINIEYDHYRDAWRVMNERQEIRMHEAQMQRNRSYQDDMYRYDTTNFNINTAQTPRRINNYDVDWDFRSPFLEVAADINKRELKKEYGIKEDLNNFKDNDMTETVEVTLNPDTLKGIMANLSTFAKSKENELKLYESKINSATKDKYPDNDDRAQVKKLWEVRLENALTSIKLCDKLLSKFKSDERPIKLQKNERKILANVIDVLNFNYSMICPHSNISNINHPDRFYMFPNLEKAVKKKIAEFTFNIKNLTRSDVNVYVK